MFYTSLQQSLSLRSEIQDFGVRSGFPDNYCREWDQAPDKWIWIGLPKTSLKFVLVGSCYKRKSVFCRCALFLVSTTFLLNSIPLQHVVVLLGLYGQLTNAAATHCACELKYSLYYIQVIPLFRTMLPSTAYSVTVDKLIRNADMVQTVWDKPIYIATTTHCTCELKNELQ